MFSKAVVLLGTWNFLVDVPENEHTLVNSLWELL